MMRKSVSMVIALCVCVALPVIASAQEKTLCERLGGPKAIAAVVERFAQKLGQDERVNKKLAKSDPQRFGTNATAFVEVATHCPGVTYTGRSMQRAHQHMGVTEGDFNATVEDLVQTVDEFKVPEREKQELLALLGPLKKDIVEKPGDMTTGTPLPANFKPAPRLKHKAAPKKM